MIRGDKGACPLVAIGHPNIGVRPGAAASPGDIEEGARQNFILSLGDFFT